MRTGSTQAAAAVGTQKMAFRHKVTDALVMAGVGILALSIVIELISWIAGFDYPFLDSLIVPFWVVALGSTLSPMYAWKSGSAVPVRAQGQPAIITTWQEAEISVRDYMRANGHPGAKLTPPGPDGGVDVIASNAIAQVKFYATPIGEPAVVQLAGTTMKPQFRGRQALFFASSGFTPKALATARDLGVELYELRGGSGWVRVR